jgi:hypothetical protein
VSSNVFLFLGEADFMPVHNMHAKLRRGSTGTLLSEARHAWNSPLAERRAVIVPAFEHIAQERIRAQDAARTARKNATGVDELKLGRTAFSSSEFGI